jgi:hypothetical protein
MVMEEEDDKEREVKYADHSVVNKLTGDVNIQEP